VCERERRENYEREKGGRDKKRQSEIERRREERDYG
jgi:hypothetical protein